MKKKFLALIIFLISVPSFAFDEQLLRYSPVSYFTPNDIRIYINAAREALNEALDKEPYPWSNPETGASGYFIPSHSVRKNGVICRNLYVHTVAKKVGSSASFKICRFNEIWVIVS